MIFIGPRITASTKSVVKRSIGYGYTLFAIYNPLPNALKSSSYNHFWISKTKISYV